MITRINSYPSIYAIGHKAITDIFDGEVLVEEKIDGSQFSSSRIDGNLHCKSKKVELVIDAPEKLFEKAVESAKSLDLRDGWIYRFEYLQKPKHNTLAYDRIPKNHLMVFDVQTGIEQYMNYDEKKSEAERIGVECVPLLFKGVIKDFEALKELLDTDSILGGTKIEGIVVKNYEKFTRDKKVMMGKYVSERFKEIHTKDWKTRNRSSSDIVGFLILEHRTEARWQKAIHHLRESGELEGSPRDIGRLMKEVPEDVLKECEEEIKDKLFKHFWPKIRRGLTTGLPEWYKEKLAKESF